MKHNKYTVYFENGITFTVWAFSPILAAILSMAEAVKAALPYKIEVIKDSKGKEYYISQNLEIDKV